MIQNLGMKYITDRDELEDFVQEAFIQAYQSLSQFRGEAEFSTWLYRIARNQLTKKSNLKKTIPIDDHNQFDTLPLSTLQKWNALRNQAGNETAILKEEISSRIRALVSSLPSKYKAPIVLYYFENLSYKEIADRLNLKVNTLKSTIRRGKGLLKELFHE